MGNSAGLLVRGTPVAPARAPDGEILAERGEENKRKHRTDKTLRIRGKVTMMPG